MLVDNPSIYFTGIESELQNLSKRGIKHLFRPSEELSVEVVRLLKETFYNGSGYVLELRKCNQCVNIYDVIISF